MNTITLQLSDETMEALATLIAAKMGGGGGNGRSGVYTVTQAAKRLQVCPDTIRRRVMAGVLPRIPGIGKMVIPASAIEKLIETEA